MAKKKCKKSSSTQQMSMGGNIGMGAAQGAAMGAMIAPPFGAIAGAVVGGVKGYFDGKAEQAQEKALNEEELKTKINQQNLQQGVDTQLQVDQSTIDAMNKANKNAQTANTVFNLVGTGASMYSSMGTPGLNQTIKKADGGALESEPGLVEFQGERHEQGGIPLQGADIEVEGGETSIDNFVFSDRIKLPNSNKTFAQESKRIKKQYSQRKNDEYDEEAMEEELSRLAMMQEMLKERDSLKEKKHLMDGVKMSDGGNIELDPIKGSILLREASRRGTSVDNIIKEVFEDKIKYETGGELLDYYAMGGKISIDKNKKGTFTAAATKHNMGIQEFANYVLNNKDNFSPIMVKKAVFAKNASNWKKSYGGNLFANGGALPGEGDKGEKKKEVSAKIANSKKEKLQLLEEVINDKKPGSAKYNPKTNKLEIKLPNGDFVEYDNAKEAIDFANKKNLYNTRQFFLGETAGGRLVYKVKGSNQEKNNSNESTLSDNATINPENTSINNTTQTPSNVISRDEAIALLNQNHIDPDSPNGRMFIQMATTDPKDNLSLGLSGRATPPELQKLLEQVDKKATINQYNPDLPSLQRVNPEQAGIDPETARRFDYDTNVYPDLTNVDYGRVQTSDQPLTVFPKDIADAHIRSRETAEKLRQEFINARGINPKTVGRNSWTREEMEQTLGKDKTKEYYDAMGFIGAMDQKFFPKRAVQIHGEIEGDIPTSQQRVGTRHLNKKLDIEERGKYKVTPEIYKELEKIYLKDSPTQMSHGGSLGMNYDTYQSIQSELNRNNPLQDPSHVYGLDILSQMGNMLSQRQQGIEKAPMKEFSPEGYGSPDIPISNTSTGTTSTDKPVKEEKGKDIAENYSHLDILFNTVGQNMGNLYNLSQGLSGAEKVSPYTVSPNLVNYDASRDQINQQRVIQQNNMRENIRQNATTSGQALSNLMAGDIRGQQVYGTQLSTIGQQEANQNAQIRNQTQLANLQAQQQADMINQANEAMATNVTSQALSNIGQNLAQFSKDKRLTDRDNNILKNLGTENLRFVPKADGTFKIYFVDPSSGEETLIRE